MKYAAQRAELHMRPRPEMIARNHATMVHKHQAHDRRTTSMRLASHSIVGAKPRGVLPQLCRDVEDA